MAEWTTTETLAEAQLVTAHHRVRVTVEHGDALACDADVLALKYAQASYGLDHEVLDRLGRHDRAAIEQLPVPGRWIKFDVPDLVAARSIVMVGTPPLDRFGYAAVRAWGTDVIEALSKNFQSIDSLVVTLHGVRIGVVQSLDEERSLMEEVAGLRAGLVRVGSSMDLRAVRIIERDDARARRVARVLAEAAREDRGSRPVVDTDLSRSVAHARDMLSHDSIVTAGAFASMVQAAHPEYGGARLGSVEFAVDAGSTASVDLWLSQVVALYPSVRHGDKVLDGRRLIAGLAVLDRGVRAALDEKDAGRAILDEMSERPNEPPRREDVKLSPDEPTDQDQLGRRLVAKALVDQLAEFDRDHGGRTFMFLIDGPWGAGKSTLLQFIRDDLRKRSESAEGTGPSCVVADFDAWRQSMAGPSWLLMMTTLQRALRSAGEMSRFGWAKERARRIGRVNLFALVALVLALAVIATLWAADIATPDTAKKVVAGGLGLLVLLWPASRAVGRWLTVDTKRGARGFIDTRRDPMEDVAEHFGWLRGRTKRPLVLLIDDLDRCDPEYVVDLLDSVQKLVRAQGIAAEFPTLFIGVAADGRWLREAYQAKYASLGDAIAEPGRPLGSLFLDKLFQLRVPVPELSPTSQRAFLSGLLGVADNDRASKIAAARDRLSGVSSGQVLDTLRDIDADVRVDVAGLAFDRLQSDGVSVEARHALERFAALLEPNPRSVLRFTMAFSMLRAVRTAEGNAVAPDELALWTIASIRWPLLAEYLSREPDAVQLFQLTARELAGRVPPELSELFEHPTGELQRVFNHEVGGPLTSDIIRQCTGVA